MMSKLQPREPVPAFTVATVDGEPWSLADQQPQNFTMVVFYRGLHCPICGTYLKDLNDKLDAFAELGVDAIAISGDDAERAAAAKAKWRLDELSVGYGLDHDVAAAWGLYFSSGRGKTSVGIEEPPVFFEPGLFMVRPDRTLYFGSVQTMPFARPAFGDILKATEFVLQNDYPARGELRRAA